MPLKRLKYNPSFIRRRIKLMRVCCPECESNAYINTRKKLSNAVTDLYCCCSSVECGHTFVSTLSFKHTISPSKNQTMGLIGQLLKEMPEAKLKEILVQNNISFS